VCAFINGGGHDFLSNQVLGSLVAPQCNLGEPRNVRFDQMPGLQAFDACDGTVSVERTNWTNLKKLFR
jgi:hypothetical protein